MWLNAQAFREDVGELLQRVDVLRSKNTAENAITQLIRMVQDVLGLLESHRIGSQIKRRFTIDIQRSRPSDAETNRVEKITAKTNS